MSTAPDDDRIEVFALGQLKQLGSGGQGTVYAVPSQKIFNTWPAALKEYRPEVLPQLDGDALEAMVHFLRRLSFEQGSKLIERAAWPWRVATRNGVVTGFLMREVPPEYRLRLRGPRGEEDHLAQVQHVLNSPTFLSYRNIVFDDRLRLEFLRDVAETLVLFHSLSIVVGDLSPRNLLFSNRTSPRCFFIDCDAMRLRRRTALAQAETPEWNIPPGEELATPAADAYKFALLAVRLFAGDQFTWDPQALARISPALVDLARRGLTEDATQRALPREWLAPLSDVLAVMAASPTQSLQTVPRRAPGAPQVPGQGQPPAMGPPIGGQAPAPRSAGPRRKLYLGRWATAAVVLVLLVVLGTKLFGGGAPGSNATPAQTPTTPQQTADQQVAAFVSVLSDAENARTQLTGARKDVGSCTDIQQAVDTLQNVVTLRANELSAAKALGTDQINADTAKQHLVAALGYALSANQDYLKWGQERMDSGCSASTAKTSALEAATSESSHASDEKIAFVNAWAPIASQYGAPVPDPSDL